MSRARDLRKVQRRQNFEATLHIFWLLVLAGIFCAFPPPPWLWRMGIIGFAGFLSFLVWVNR